MEYIYPNACISTVDLLKLTRDLGLHTDATLLQHYIAEDLIRPALVLRRTSHDLGAGALHDYAGAIEFWSTGPWPMIATDDVERLVGHTRVDRFAADAVPGSVFVDAAAPATEGSEVRWWWRRWQVAQLGAIEEDRLRIAFTRDSRAGFRDQTPDVVAFGDDPAGWSWSYKGPIGRDHFDIAVVTELCERWDAARNGVDLWLHADPEIGRPIGGRRHPGGRAARVPALRREVARRLVEQMGIDEGAHEAHIARLTEIVGKLSAEGSRVPKLGAFLQRYLVRLIDIYMRATGRNLDEVRPRIRVPGWFPGSDPLRFLLPEWMKQVEVYLGEVVPRTMKRGFDSDSGRRLHEKLKSMNMLDALRPFIESNDFWHGTDGSREFYRASGRYVAHAAAELELFAFELRGATASENTLGHHVRHLLEATRIGSAVAAWTQTMDVNKIQRQSDCHARLERVAALDDFPPGVAKDDVPKVQSIVGSRVIRNGYSHLSFSSDRRVIEQTPEVWSYLCGAFITLMDAVDGRLGNPM